MVSTMFQEDFPISIHTLRVEGDRLLRSGNLSLTDFYPHPPCGG